MNKSVPLLILIAVPVAVFAMSLSLPAIRRADAILQENTCPNILIDPGHGGFDGGACGADGTLEKDLNLAISLSLRDLLGVMGYDARMTRTDDSSLYEENDGTVRSKKVGDMKKRLELYEKSSLVVSIHQNHFSDPQYFGAQIFYSSQHEFSRPLADSIRTAVLSLTQPENTRELKKADDGLYLMSRTSKPTVLVECGFLSNSQELKKLKTPSYQKDMAFAVAGGIMAFYGDRAAPSE